MVSFINTKWNIYYVKSILKEQPIAALALCLLLYYIASKNILSVIFGAVHLLRNTISGLSGPPPPPLSQRVSIWLTPPYPPLGVINGRKFIPL